MKASANTLDALKDLDTVRTNGDLNRIISVAALALVRDEISVQKVEALADAGEAVAKLMDAQVKHTKLQLELHKAGRQIGEIAEMGRLTIDGKRRAPIASSTVSMS